MIYKWINAKQNNSKGKKSKPILHGKNTTCRDGRQEEHNNVESKAEKN